MTRINSPHRLMGDKAQAKAFGMSEKEFIDATATEEDGEKIETNKFKDLIASMYHRGSRRVKRMLTYENLDIAARAMAIVGIWLALFVATIITALLLTTINLWLGVIFSGVVSYFLARAATTELLNLYFSYKLTQAMKVF